MCVMRVLVTADALPPPILTT